MSDKIQDWSRVALENNAAPPNGAPENGTTIADLNDIMREMMATVRSYFESTEWRDYGLTIVPINATSFKVSAGNFTGLFFPGQRLKITDTTTKYGMALTVVEGADVTVTVLMDDGASLVTPTVVEVGFLQTKQNAWSENSIRQYGALGDGVIDDTTAIDNAPGNSDVPIGDFMHTGIATTLLKDYSGRGQINTSDGKRGRNIFRLDSPPTFSLGNSIVDFYDTMPTRHCFDVYVTGATTVGDPADTPGNYEQHDEAHPVFYGALFNSGKNASLTNADGRTGWAIERFRLQHDGDGDAFCSNMNVFMTSSDAAHTGLAGQTAGGLLNGQMGSSVNNVYFNSFEWNYADSGNSVKTVGIVFNFTRNGNASSPPDSQVPPVSANADNWWSGIRMQSKGSVKVDSAFQVVGNGGWKWSLDHSCEVQRVDVALKAADRIYMDATPVTETANPAFHLYAQSVGQKYFHYLSGTDEVEFKMGLRFGKIRSLIGNTPYDPLDNGSFCVYADAGENNLIFKYKTTAGAFKTGSIPIS